MFSQLKNNRLVRDCLTARLASPMPLPPPQNKNDPNYNYNPQWDIQEPRLLQRLAQASNEDELQVMLRSIHETRLKNIGKIIADLEEAIGDFDEVLDTGDETFEELPSEIVSAVNRNDSMILRWLGNPPIARARIGAKCHTRADNSLLHEAVFEGHLNLMRILLQFGADKDARNCFGTTPLGTSCLFKRLNGAARLLLEWGASNDGPEDSDCADQIAEQTGNKPLVALLRTALGGRRCEIVGLQRRADLNGCKGVADKFISKTERYAFTVEKTGEHIQVRPANLQRCDRTAQDCGKRVIFVAGTNRGKGHFIEEKDS
jgi:hypothetical protein